MNLLAFLIGFQISVAAVASTPLRCQLLFSETDISEANKLIGSIKKELNLPKGFRKDAGPISPSLLKKLENAVETQTAPLFNKLSPHLFEPGFQHHNKNSWQRLENSDVVLKHFNEVLNFLSRDESEFISEKPDGSHLLAAAQSRLLDITQEKLKAVDSVKKEELEGLVIDVLQTEKNNLIRLPKVLHAIEMMGFSSETLLFELIEVRKNILSSPKIPAAEKKELTNPLQGAIFTVASGLKTFSTIIQLHLLNNDHKFKLWPDLLALNSSEKLIDPVNAVIRVRLIQNENLWHSLKFAEYFVQHKLYKEDVLSFLKDTLNNSEIFPEQRAQAELLLKALE